MLAQTLGFHRTKVYKWFWDRRGRSKSTRLYSITTSLAEFQKMADRAVELRGQRSLLSLHFEQAIIALEEDRVIPLVKDDLPQKN